MAEMRGEATPYNEVVTIEEPVLPVERVGRESLLVEEAIGPDGHGDGFTGLARQAPGFLDHLGVSRVTLEERVMKDVSRMRAPASLTRELEDLLEGHRGALVTPGRTDTIGTT